MTFLVAACLAAALPQDARGPEWVELRFHRIHLRNGNFIDGTLIKDEPKGLTLRLPAGEMLVRRDQVDRVEFVKLRSILEKPEAVKSPPAPAPAPRSGTPGVAPGPAPSPTPTPSQPIAKVDPDLAAKIDELLDSLVKADAETKSVVADQIYKVGPSAAPYLASLLPKFDLETLPHVTDVILRLKNPSAGPHLAQHLNHPRTDLVGQCLSLLGASGDTESAQYVHPLLKNPDAGIRGMAVSACHALGNWDSYAPVSNLLEDPQRDIRQRAIYALNHLATKHDRREDLARTLVDHADRAPDAALPDLLDALAKTGKKTVWTNIERHLRSDSPSVRAAAAYALGVLEAKEAGEMALSQARVESSPAVQGQLAITLQKLGQVQAVPVLIEWLENGPEEVKISARQGLSGLSGQNFLNDVEKWKAWWEANKPKQ